MKKIEYYNNVTVEDFERYFELKALGLEQYRIMLVMNGTLTKDEALNERKEEQERIRKHVDRMFHDIYSEKSEVTPF